jgi:hypothetical protein
MGASMAGMVGMSSISGTVGIDPEGTRQLPELARVSKGVTAEYEFQQPAVKVAVLAHLDAIQVALCENQTLTFSPKISVGKFYLDAARSLSRHYIFGSSDGL